MTVLLAKSILFCCLRYKYLRVINLMFPSCTFNKRILSLLSKTVHELPQKLIVLLLLHTVISNIFLLYFELLTKKIFFIPNITIKYDTWKSYLFQLWRFLLCHHLLYSLQVNNYLLLQNMNLFKLAGFYLLCPKWKKKLFNDNIR